MIPLLVAQLPLLLVVTFSMCGSFQENSDFIDLSTLGDNAFIEPDIEMTGKRVANLTEDSHQNPEELGAYFEGDILMPQRFAGRNALLAKSIRWPNNVIPYVVHGNFTTAELTAIGWAFRLYHKNTCIRFKRRSKETDYVSIVNDASGCWSAVGRVGGKQKVNLQAPCLQRRGTILHEFMHVLGFMHEHNRFDRDSYITVLSENIRDDMMEAFVKLSKSVANGLGIGYDYSSVMHYSTTSFSKNGQPTIEVKKDTEEAKSIGQRTGFSSADVAKINLMYKCKGKYRGRNTVREEK